MSSNRPPRRSLCVAAALCGGLTLNACQSPPPGFVIGREAVAAKPEIKSAGNNLTGEACRYEPSTLEAQGDLVAAFDIYCGSWQQPSSRLLQAKTQASPADLVRLATASPWRNGLNERATCDAPVETTVSGGGKAALMKCRQLSGGWPHMAMVANVGGSTFFVDGVPAATPAVEVSMASIAGLPIEAAGKRSSAADLIAATIAARPFGSNDLNDYYRLKRLGEDANDTGDYAAAEQAFRAALEIQERVLKPDDSALADPLMSLALQLSNQDHTREAEAAFARARLLLKLHPDPLLIAELDLYEAEDAANRGRLEQARDDAGRAVRGFSMLTQSGRAGIRPVTMGRINDSLFMSPAEEQATVGLGASWWFQSYLAYSAGDYAAASALAERADQLLRSTGLNAPGLQPRSVRIMGLAASGRKDFDAATYRLRQAADAFSIRQANNREGAVTLFLAGRNALSAGDPASALSLFREGVALAKDLKVGLPARMVEIYLQTLTSGKTGLSDEAAAEEGLTALQLIQSDQTARVLAQAFARLSATNDKTRDLLRTMQDADLSLQRLLAERDVEEAKPRDMSDPARLTAIDKEITETRARRNEVDNAAQAASPEYHQLVQSGVTSAKLREQLKPNEGFLTFQVGVDATYELLVTANALKLTRIPLGEAALLNTVIALRKTIVPAEDSPPGQYPQFDTDGAHALYQTLFGPTEAETAGLKKLVIVPSGPLAMLPMEVLVTAPTSKVTDGNYAQTPFLVEKMSVSYIPSAANFVVQRRDISPSAATQPYIGFGDFRPATTRQLEASFPPDRCAADLAGLKDLPPLPGTRREISYIGQTIFKAPATDIVLGDRFTKAALFEDNLSQFRIVHFATHGLLPTDLSCRPDATIIVSPDPEAASADSAFLGLKDVLALKLDANLVLLSACNTGNGGQNTGDSLSGLARSFFFAGARGLLVTHWELSDRSGPLLTAATLAPHDANADAADALREAKLFLIHDVATRFGKDGNFFTHPYAWAAFVLVGDGGRKAEAKS